jgi:hypothetical protein
MYEASIEWKITLAHTGTGFPYLQQKENKLINKKHITQSRISKPIQGNETSLQTTLKQN